MVFFNRLFADAKQIAKDAEHDKKIILENLKNYFARLSEKVKLANNLQYQFGERKQALQEIKKLIERELSEIKEVNKAEKDLFYDVASFEQSHLTKRIDRLEWFVEHAETEYGTIHKCLKKIHHLHKKQNSLMDNLLSAKDLRKYRKLTDEFKQLTAAELDMANTLSRITDFQDIVCELARGNYIIHSMDASEKRLLRRIKDGMRKIFSNQIDEGVTYEWAMTVFENIEQKVAELVQSDLMHQHSNVDFEYVNSAAFIELVQSSIYQIKKKNVSNEMLNVFVHLFREWYNHERD